MGAPSSDRPPVGYLYALDLTTWGWIHLILGALIAAAGSRAIVGSGGAGP